MQQRHHTDNLIHTKLYKSSLFIGIILSVISITSNFMGGLPILENVKWMGLLIICTLFLVLLEYRIFTGFAKFFLFIFLIWVFIPLGFIESGSSKTITYSYMMLLVILTSLLFQGKARFWLLASLLVVFIVLHTLDYMYPNIIGTYNRRAYFIDQIIQLPVIILSAFYILRKFSNEHIELNKKLDDLANIDNLTDLYNRRGFDKAMHDIVRYDIRNAQLAFIDVDNFKQLNDKFGHSIGDEALRVLSNYMKQVFNPSQHVLARWGGDEFAIIYYGEKNCLLDQLEIVKKAFGEYAINYLTIVKISTSVISFSDFDTLEEAMLEADKLLYNEKNLQEK